MSTYCELNGISENLIFFLHMTGRATNTIFTINSSRVYLLVPRSESYIPRFVFHLHCNANLMSEFRTNEDHEMTLFLNVCIPFWLHINHISGNSLLNLQKGHLFSLIPTEKLNYKFDLAV